MRPLAHAVLYTALFAASATHAADPADPFAGMEPAKPAAKKTDLGAMFDASVDATAKKGPRDTVPTLREAPKIEVNLEGAFVARRITSSKTGCAPAKKEPIVTQIEAHRAARTPPLALCVRLAGTPGAAVALTGEIRNAVHQKRGSFDATITLGQNGKHAYVVNLPELGTDVAGPMQLVLRAAGAEKAPVTLFTVVRPTAP